MSSQKDYFKNIIFIIYIYRYTFQMVPESSSFKKKKKVIYSPYLLSIFYALSTLSTLSNKSWQPSIRIYIIISIL